MIECNEFEANKEFDEFIKTDYIILRCKGNTKINRLSIFNDHLYSNETEKLPANFKDYILIDHIAQQFFVRYGTIEGETRLPPISDIICEMHLKERNEDVKFKDSGIKCFERDGKIFVSKKVKDPVQN